MNWNIGVAILMLGGLCAGLALIKSTAMRVILIGVTLAVVGVVIQLEVKKRDVLEKVWHPQAVEWKKIPIDVYWDRSVFLPYNETFEQAIKTWNRRIGCEVLRPGHSEGASVLIRSFDGRQCSKDAIGVEVEESPNALASAWYCSGYVDIQMKQLDHVKLAFRVALHELGHALALDHDDAGAMAKTVVEPMTNDPPEYLLPSNKDVAAIKERYCP